MVSLDLAFAIIPGLILFLYGIDHFTKEIQQIAGEKFRNILAKLTENRVAGSLLGAFVTSILQSSTATTVIAIGLVGAGTISFIQSLGLIVGANVGTTVTAQLVALELTAFAPIFILFGFLLSLFGRKYKFIGKPLFYFGLVFFALSMISNAMEPLQHDESIRSIFSHLSNIFVALFVGFIFTVLVQSSSVTTGIVVVFVGSGFLALNQGIPLIMGANIGTTTTSLLAALKLDVFAKRAAVAHFLFNIGGVLLFLPFLPVFIDLINGIGGESAQQMANAHTFFNVITAALFLMALKPFASIIENILPGEEEEIIFKTKYIREPMPSSIQRSFGLIEKELPYSLDITAQMFNLSVEMLKKGNSKLLFRVSKLETFNDFLDKQISESLIDLSMRRIAEDDVEKILLLVRMSNSIEQLGDLAKDLAYMKDKMQDSGLFFSEESMGALVSIYSKFEENLVLIRKVMPKMTEEQRDKIRNNDQSLRELITREYKGHMKRHQESKVYAGAAFVEAISIMESANLKLREIRKLSEKYSVLDGN